MHALGRSTFRDELIFVFSSVLISAAFSVFFLPFMFPRQIYQSSAHVRSRIHDVINLTYSYDVIGVTRNRLRRVRICKRGTQKIFV